VSDPITHTALSAVASDAGWTEQRTPRPGAFAVTDFERFLATADRRGGDGTPDAQVLVVGPSPYAARCALEAMADGSVLALVSSQHPSDLVDALELLRGGLGTVSVVLFEQAAAMPRLSARKVTVLSAIVAGQSNREIARGIYLSEASVKREITELFGEFAASSRLMLAAVAQQLGIPGQRVTP